MKHLTRKFLFSLTENLWAAGFSLAGRMRHPAQEWASQGGQHILALAPHPDDEVAGCGGTLIRHHQAGDTTHLVYVTDGRGSRAGGLSPNEMAQRRAAEAQESAHILGVSQVTFLGLKENEWEVEALVRVLKTLFENFPITIVYTSSRVDFHPEHHKVAHAVALALAQSVRTDIRMRVYQLHVPLGNLVNRVCATASVAAIWRAALAAHATQWGSTERVLRMAHYSAAYFGLAAPAEVFWELPAQTYIHLHRQPLPWATGLFRGVRARPFSDPFAYWTGSKTRKTLLNI
jgi:LmbE family N-acetylglucosaminyl deacetylase